MTCFLKLLSASAYLLVLPTALFAVDDSSPLIEKSKYFQRNLLEKHWLDGLYVSIVPTAPDGVEVPHTVDQPGNIIHAGVWTGRYLGGVGYQYAVTKDPRVREHGGQILRGLRVLQEVTGKPGLLARGYMKGHGPVMGYERAGSNSIEWHQGTGEYADYRWYGDVSVDNFNAVLYGYAIYYDLAADEEQKQYIAHDVDRLMTHLLDHHCRIVDVDGEVTRYGHVGIDPDPARKAYYEERYSRRYRRYGAVSIEKLPLRTQLMLLPDLLIAHRVTGKQRYRDFYDHVVATFKHNPARSRTGERSSQPRRRRVNHSSEGQRYEALYNLVRYEQDPELRKRYREWVSDLWEANWIEGNSLFAYMSLALLSDEPEPTTAGALRQVPGDVPHASEGLRLANRTLELFPIDRVLRPVMNSIRDDIEINTSPGRLGRQVSVKPLLVNERPRDNEYEWKGNPYRLDGWLKPTLTAFQVACDDPKVAWFSDNRGRIFNTLDGGSSWRDVTLGLMGASVQNIVASDSRTFVLWAETDKGIYVTRDGGMSWRQAADKELPEFSKPDFAEWQAMPNGASLRINDGKLEHSMDTGNTSEPAMNGWRIPLATSCFVTPWGVIAGGPGGVYRAEDGNDWQPLTLWREDETGAADFLHAYWMGRYYGFLPEETTTQ